MTTPAQQAPAAAAAATDAALAAEAAVVLLDAITVAGVILRLQAVFLRAGVPRPALAVAVDVVMGMPPEASGMTGPATQQMIRMNLVRRAQFLVSSARRVTSDLRAGRSQGQSLRSILDEAAARERRYYGQHLDAIWNRMDAAAKTDSASMLYGRLLGWNTVLDSVTSPECRAANRHNFLADQMPLIGYPGMVHPHCRCWPGRPYPGASMLPSEGGLLRRMAHGLHPLPPSGSRRMPGRNVVRLPAPAGSRRA